MHLLGVPIHPLDQRALVDLLIAYGDADRLRKVFNVNVHAMNLACEDQGFAAALRDADVVFCDGYGVKWGARLAGIEIPHRLTPPDWIDDFAAATARAGQSVFALGDVEGVAERFQALIACKHPGYKDAGSHHGFFAKSGAPNEDVIEEINASGATHLLVGFGMPLQEHWIVSNAARLTVRTAISVGALFHWRTDVERRAPRWVTDNGLEWFARFVRHPIRHFRRYAIGNPRFLLRVAHERLTR